MTNHSPFCSSSSDRSLVSILERTRRFRAISLDGGIDRTQLQHVALRVYWYTASREWLRLCKEKATPLMTWGRRTGVTRRRDLGDRGRFGSCMSPPVDET